MRGRQKLSSFKPELEVIYIDVPVNLNLNNIGLR